MGERADETLVARKAAAATPHVAARAEDRAAPADHLGGHVPLRDGRKRRGRRELSGRPWLLMTEEMAMASARAVLAALW
jgi:hypothetical protein